MGGRYKVAIVMINLNEPYWQYLIPCIQSLKKFFLRGHDLDFFVWTDIPKEKIVEPNVKVIPTEPYRWPTPTLQRYTLFLREEELLKEYDFIYYCDSDMLAVARIGDEVLTDDLTGAQHPMYALAQMYIPPYEPNKDSTAYIPRPGRIVEKDGKKRLEPLYWAGGFQGGRSENFITAMKVMKKNIDIDFANNYIAIWNDESHWNRYLFDNPPSVTLSPEYVYPDSLNRAYYQKVWGKNFMPRLVTLTKPFSITANAGMAINQILNKV